MAKIFVAFTIVNDSNCFLVAREKDDPLSEVYRSPVLTTPHTQRNITIDNLNPVMHIIELWTTTDGINLDSFLGSCDIDASITNEVAFGVIQFIVGRGNGAPEYDPAPDQAQYVNPDLDGKDYIVYKEGFGVLKWGVDIQTISGGGFEFINGTLFSAGEGYTVQYSNVVTSSTTSSGRSFPSDVVEITGDIAFSSAHYNKLLEVNSSAAVVTITIASLDTIPNGTLFGINAHNGTQNFVTLQLNTGRYCLINGNQENAVYIGRAEEVTFIKKGSYLRVVSGSEHFNKVGLRVFADGLQPPGTLPETGGWYLKTDYPRPVKWYIERLPAPELGSGTDDVTPTSENITKWILGATKFWVPDTSGRFFRATSDDDSIDLDGPRLSGSNQADENKAHNHVNSTWNKAGARASDVGSVQIPLIDGSNANPDQKFRVAGMNTSLWNLATILSQGTESRPKNVATNVYRNI